MKYYSTNGQAPLADLRKAVVKGLAEDRGLYMPERIVPLPSEFFRDCASMSFHEVACAAADAFFGEDIPAGELHRIVRETLNFDCPVVNVEGPVNSLELFHGPTLAFKDVGARFMARMLRYFNDSSQELHVLVATSGDTGSAVANGFLGVEGIHVHVLYPKGKVSAIQECQFTTLGRNVTAVEVDGVFDDCQALVKSAFMDAELCSQMRLTSANSINVARFLPQSFYYFWAYAQMLARGEADNLVMCVPSGNFGNLCSALFAKKMGMPVKRFIAANNSNSVFYEFLRDGEYRPRPSVQTIANAMDVGDPSNFARIWDLYGHSWEAIRSDISGATYSDTLIADTIRDVYSRTAYICDPHGACGCRALLEGLRPGETGVFCETAHPAKFLDTVEGILDGGRGRTGSSSSVPAGPGLAKNLGQCSHGPSGSSDCPEADTVAEPRSGSSAPALLSRRAEPSRGPRMDVAGRGSCRPRPEDYAGSDENIIEIPERLRVFMRGKKESVAMSKRYDEFKDYLKQYQK